MLSGGRGTCRRYPPVQIKSLFSDVGTLQWPKTYAADWCGEHTAITKP